MQIPKKNLDEFKKIYKKDYGEDLSDDEAQKIVGPAAAGLRPRREQAYSENKHYCAAVAGEKNKINPKKLVPCYSFML
jgi:hypothetical protein